MYAKLETHQSIDGWKQGEKENGTTHSQRADLWLLPLPKEKVENVNQIRPSASPHTGSKSLQVLSCFTCSNLGKKTKLSVLAQFKTFLHKNHEVLSHFSFSNIYYSAATWSR